MKNTFLVCKHCGKIKYHYSEYHYSEWVIPSHCNLVALKQLLEAKKVELVSTNCFDCLEKEEETNV